MVPEGEPLSTDMKYKDYTETRNSVLPHTIEAGRFKFSHD